MSRIVWKKALVPQVEATESYSPEGYISGFGIDKVARIPIAETDIELPDRRVYRSMSRAAVFMSRLCLDAFPVIQSSIERNPYSVGIYCAVENGPSDFLSAARLLNVSGSQFHELYKRFRSPKLYLKQLPNLAAAQAGIFLGCMGPMNIYNHSVFGGLQAFEQADLDLSQGVVEKAIVCSAFSVEDPLLTKRTALQVAEGKVLCEGAAVLVLEPSSQKFVFSPCLGAENRHFGISQDVVKAALA